MRYVVLTPDLEKKAKEVRQYRAKSKAEDSGNGFKPNTPAYILMYSEEIRDFYHNNSHDKTGKPTL